MIPLLYLDGNYLAWILADLMHMKLIESIQTEYFALTA
jgi:hypothetical protein